MYKLAVIVPFYKSIESNVEQCFIDEFTEMDDGVLKDIQLIFVDDCSPIPLNIKIENKKLNFELYRIDSDIEWNVGGAKNLGASVSDAENLLFVDADHSVSEKTIKFLIDYKLKDNEHMVFVNNRTDSPGTFFTSKKRFLELNGFDENFSGYYGYEDINYRKRHEVSGGIFTEYDEEIVVREKYHHHLLVRNAERNKKIAYGLVHSGKFINFKWHRVNLE